jgi:hypothetical protein
VWCPYCRNPAVSRLHRAVIVVLVLPALFLLLRAL